MRTDSPRRRPPPPRRAGRSGDHPGYDLRYLIGSRAQTFERLTALVVPAFGEPAWWCRDSSWPR
ncbi:putative dipeptidase pepE domain protein [Mycobacterium xenopi 4042]|uniref:Putative dipeptidase pepE domain protein n=1 Tax=Mycobacterium xenopi 4042 TaxID=1299334 RepID=X8BDG6_MYCXE|nr:putative dipeptidase pepE domain protein [Mycobacterium xenopi 4042]